MKDNIEKSLKFVKDKLKEMSYLSHAGHIIHFDFETICPKKAMSQEGDVMSFLGNLAFKIKDDVNFKKAVVELHNNINELEPLDKVLVNYLFKDYQINKNVTPEIDLESSKIFNEAYLGWIEAKNKSDFSIFLPHLNQVKDQSKKLVDLREVKFDNLYDNYFDNYERGMTSQDLDKFFDEMKKGIIPLLEKIKKSKKVICYDFMNRAVPLAKQELFSKYLLEINGFDYDQGMLSTTEHPFTSAIGQHDVRVTTHYFENNFISNAFSVIHEGGHAIFGQNEPSIFWDNFVADQMTMGMHESVSRFYENVIGRSKAYIHLIYPKFKELFKEEFSDVSEIELYEAINKVEPSLIRTEADELTYPLHIAIRYELEKDIINGKISLSDLPKKWNQKYKDYLGVTPKNDKEGVLQDVHWTGGFGYFPTYALGNAYNAMYVNTMRKTIDIDKCVASGNIKVINDWMVAHVFAKASIQTPKEWIKEITGRELDTHDFIEYLTKKYSELYHL